jgi:Trk K+ transport system NAD-binding subunit
VQTLGDVEVLEFRAGTGVANKHVSDIEIEHMFRVAVLSRGNVTFIPQPDTMLQPGDIIVGAVKEEGLTRIERYMEG